MCQKQNTLKRKVLKPSDLQSYIQENPDQFEKVENTGYEDREGREVMAGWVRHALMMVWELLMYTNNKAAVRAEDGRWHWPVDFRVPNKLFLDTLGLKNRQALWTQRQTLIRKRRVTYTPDAGNRAGQYRLIPFDRSLTPIRIAAGERQEPTLIWTQNATDSGHRAQPYINNINNKHTSLSYYNQEDAPFVPQFNLLPQIPEEEKAAIRAQYPGDEVAAFNAIWAAREAKQKGETT